MKDFCLFDWFLIFFAVGLANPSQEEVTNIENAEKVKCIESNINKTSSTPFFKCEHCEYTAKNKVTVQKHMNTKHMDVKILDESVKKNTFSCDKCSFTSAYKPMGQIASTMKKK